MNNMITISVICMLLWGSAFSVSAGTWKDNFEDGNLDEWKTYKLDWPAAVLVPGAGNWHVEDGILIGGDDNSDILHMLTTGEMWWKDYTVEVSVKFSKELRNCEEWTSVYLGVRGQEPLPQACYMLAIQYFGIGWKQIQVEGGKMVVPPVEVAGGMIGVERPAAAMHQFPKTLFKTEADRWYRLKVTVEGDLIECFVDGKQVSEFQSKLYSSGIVGFAVGGVVAMFDDFAVTGPDIPSGGPGVVAVNPQAKLAIAWGRIKQAD